MTAILGMNAVLGYNASGIGDSGDFLELSNVKDLTLNLSTAEADATTRANQGWRATEPTLNEGELSFNMVWDTDDAGFTAIRTAWQNRSLIGMAVLDGPLTTGKGWKFDAKVIGFEITQPLEEVIEVAVTMKVAYSDDAPAYVSSGVNTP